MRKIQFHTAKQVYLMLLSFLLGSESEIVNQVVKIFKIYCISIEFLKILRDGVEPNRPLNNGFEYAINSVAGGTAEVYPLTC